MEDTNNHNVELKLVGITYNQIESGVYALILEGKESKKRLAIVIGYPEAQSIECFLQQIKTPRPLSHDLMSAIITKLNAHLSYIYIHKLPAGPYAAELHLVDEIGRKIVLDSRSSDAIALAIRMDAPIFTSSELMDKEGFDPDSIKIKTRSAHIGRKDGGMKNKAKNDSATELSDAQLKKEFEEAVLSENYERAARLKEELDRRGIQPDPIL